MKTKDEIPQLIHDFIYAQAHRLLDDDVGQAVTDLMQHGIVDDLVRNLIQVPVRRHKIAQMFLGPFEIPTLNYGDLVQGINQRGKEIRFPNRYLNGHSLTVGGTGSGKTTKSRFLILQIANSVKGLWCFDFVKQEFAVLKPYLARLGINLLIVSAREIRLNPLQCQEPITPLDWAPKIADVLVQTLQLPSRATKLLHTTILKMYQQFGIFDGSKHFPTLFDLRETIAADTDANYQAKQAIVDSLDPVLMSIGTVLRYRVGWNSQDLARRHIVFELGGIAEVDKNLILNSLILPEFTSRVAQGVSNPIMDLWICCDEAARLISSANQGGGIANLIGLIRGTGIGLDLSIQSCDVVSTVLSNTANKFIGRCGSATDYDTIGASIGLNREQRAWLNTNLRPGLFIGQLGEGDWRQPFIFEIPKMSLDSRLNKKAGGCDDITELMSLPTVIAEEFIDWPSVKSHSNSHPPAADTETNESGLSNAEIRYIKSVIDHPGKPSSALPKLAHVSSRRAQEIRRHLVDMGYLREHRVSTGKRGRSAVVLEPLEPALQAIRDMKRGTS